MKFLLLFLVLFTPLASVLWFIAGDFPDNVSLDARSAGEKTDPVFDTKEMPYLPLSGELLHLRNVNFQRFHPEENYVLYWVHADGLERVDGKPRVKNITCAVFGKPKDGAENLRIRVVAPYLEGDPSAIIAAAADESQELVLGGGVEIFDHVGRLIAELDRIVIDLGKDLIWSDSDIHFRHPERRAELHGKGLTSNLKFTKSTILSDVRLTLPLREGEDELVTIASKGAADIERMDDRSTTITMRGGVRIRHREFYGKCSSLHASVLESKSGEYLIQSVTLRDEVTFEIDPKFAAGLEEFRADEVTLLGEHTIVMTGGKLPVRAVRRGELEAFGLGDRVLDLTAPEIRLHLDRNIKQSLKDPLEAPLTRVEFPEGVTVRDRDGPGLFAAGSLTYDVRAGTLSALGGVAASAPGRSFKSETAFVSYVKDTKTVDVILTGEKTLSMRMAGRIGPLAQAANDLYTFSCDGPLIIASTETTHGLRAKGAVLVRSKKTPILSCDDLIVKIRGDKMRSLLAIGSVVGTDAATGTELKSDRLEYHEDHDVPRAVVLNGRPATVTAPDRVLRGNHLEYAEGGAFKAMGDVWADIVLPQGRWKFSCDYAEGIVPQDGGVPPYVLIGGKVRADGPGGERIEADRVRFSKKTGRLTLDGSPAKLRRGAGLTYVGASLVMDVVKDAAGYRVSSGKTDGAAKIRVVPKVPPRVAPDKAPVQNVASWTINLKGAADFKNDVLRIPNGADVEGFDAAGKRVIVMRGAALEFEFKNMRPLVLRCSGGMSGETFTGGKRSTRLVAEGFSYRLDSNNIDLRGPGEIWQGDAKEPIRFQEAELEVVADGVKFKYIKKLEAPLNRPRK